MIYYMGGIASDSFGGELPVRGVHLLGVGCSWAPAAILCFWGVFMVGSRWAGWGGGVWYLSAFACSWAAVAGV